MNNNEAHESPMIAAFDVTHVDGGTFSAQCVQDDKRPNIFGGQLLGQTIVAATRFDGAKSVKSINTLFLRSGTVHAPLQVEVEPLHSGRAFASLSVRISQGDRLLCTSQVLMDAGEPDLMRHQTDTMPERTPPDEALAQVGPAGPQVAVADGVDVNDPSLIGPPEVDVWMRWRDLVEDQAMQQAALAWYSDPFLIGAAMRPHEGIGLIQSHETISTGVISHMLTFHERVSLADWVLITNRAPLSGSGRIYGEGHVFDSEGSIVASFVQTSMVRNFRSDVLNRGRAGGAM